MDAPFGPCFSMAHVSSAAGAAIGGAPVRLASVLMQDTQVPLFCMCNAQRMRTTAYALFSAVGEPGGSVTGFAMVTKVISVKDPRYATRVDSSGV